MCSPLDACEKSSGSLVETTSFVLGVPPSVGKYADACVRVEVFFICHNQSKKVEGHSPAGKTHIHGSS